MTQYYIAANGNNANAGTSPSSPWQTIGKVNGFAQASGDIYSFRGGDIFSDATLVPAAGGTTFNSYGTGNATISQATHPANDGLTLTQLSGVTISNLNFVGSPLSTTAVGVRCLFPSGSYNNLTLSGLNVSTFGSDGIRVSCFGGGFLSGLTIDLCNVSNCTFGDSNPSPPDPAHPTNGIGAYGQFGSDVSGTYNLTNVTISRCTSNFNPGSWTRGPSSGSGIYMAEVNGGLITQCVTHDNGGTGPNNFCPIGTWIEDCASVTIQYCESYNNMNPPGNGDAGGFDLDGGCKNCIIQYCYSHNNNGNGFESLALDTNPGGAVTGNHNNIIRYNISEGDATALVTNQAGIVVSCIATTHPNSGLQVYGNTVYGNVNGVPCLVYGSFGGLLSGTIANNIFYSLSNSLVSYYNFANIHINFYGNCYFPAGGTTFVFWWNGVGYSSLAALRTATGQEVLSGQPVGVQADPGLVNPGNGETVGTGANYVTPAMLATLSAYRIITGSPANQAGLNLTTAFGITPPATDFYGNAVSATAMSIGADNPVFPATFTVTIDVPPSGTRDQELFYIERALERCANQARSAGGQVLGGSIQTDLFKVLGNYTYSPFAPS